MEEFVIDKQASIVYSDGLITKEKIDIMVNYLCNLISSYGTNKPIGVLINRDVWTILANLSCLKLGIPYVPININYPMNRIEYVLNDCEVELIITTKKVRNMLGKSRKCICIDDITMEDIKKQTNEKVYIENFNDVAYIMYTSGTTGNPKGVQIYRQSLIRLNEGINQIINFEKKCNIACLTEPCFDIFYVESIMPLCLGMNVYLAGDDEVDNPKKLSIWLKNMNIDAVQMTPSRLQQLIYVDNALKCLGNIKKILIGGEPLNNNMLEILQKNKELEIYNMYGPTETTVWSSIADLSKTNEITIGKPIKGTNIHILDETMVEVEKGKIGEICISGEGVAKGYINQEEMNKKKFINYKGMRIYRTGDLGKKTENEEYVCLGRIDNQVKVNGKRIELEEIENNVCQYDDILAAAVVYYGEQEKNLYVFYVALKNIVAKDIKRFLENIYPVDMVPDIYIQLKSIPQTLNGKIDRKLLERYIESRRVNNISEESDDIEYEIICLIGSVASKLINVNKKMKFKEAGLNSLSIVKIYALVEQKYNIRFDDDKLRLNAFYTIEDFINYVNYKVKNG